MTNAVRELKQIINARPAHDGDGVKIHRLAGRQLNPLLNPFLMIDEINSDDANDYIGGFPEHPHRGFETITYMKAGSMRHRDHMGNEGVIRAGDVQWMTAGAGVLHSEMPEQDQGLLHGFQLWLNLPAAEKMKPAAYTDILSANISELSLVNGATLRLIAGEVTVGDKGLKGALTNMSTQPVLADIHLPANTSLELAFNADNPAQVYVYQGATQELKTKQLGVYASGESLKIQAGDTGAEFLLLSGHPINEPLVQYGPFVMNTSEEIEQALRDFQNPEYLRNLHAGTHI